MNRRVSLAATIVEHIYEDCDLTVAPLVPCLFCGANTPLVAKMITNTVHVDGRTVAYCECPACWDAFSVATTLPAKEGDPTTKTRADNAALKRWFARRDRLLRKHLADRVLPVARALATNAEALITKRTAA